MNILGIDIGATNIDFVLWSSQKVLRKEKVSTPQTREEIIKVLEEKLELFNSSLKPSKIERIGLGVPGPLNQKRDLILTPPNLPALDHCPLGKIIEKDLGIKVKMENDGACFALAETLRGPGKDSSVVLGITLGTGLGGGIIYRGKKHKRCKIWIGAYGSGGEIGHMIIKKGGDKCSCGNRGCFEVYGSAKFFKQKGLLPQETAKGARRGEKKAVQLFEEYGRNLGIGISSLINILDPEIVVLGGGISNSFDLFSKSLIAETKKRILSPHSQKFVKIKKGKLGEFSGAIGAALLFEI